VHANGELEHKWYLGKLKDFDYEIRFKYTEALKAIDFLL
jgi:hypothetical protein